MNLSVFEQCLYSSEHIAVITRVDHALDSGL